MKLAIASLLFSAGFCAAAYPSEYPFENESLVPPSPRAAEPSWTFDDTDAGGYVYTYAYKFEITEDMIPEFCFGHNGFWSHQFVVRSGIPPLATFQEFNCTNSNFVLGDYSYFGTVADTKICTQGECCEEYWGTLTYWPVDSPYMPYYDEIGKAYEDGGCEEMFGEEVYCVIMSAGQQWGCIEQYKSATDRLVVYPCYDGFYRHYSSCKLYQIDGFMFRPATEPEAYIDESSPEEVNAVNSLYFCPDHVCRPYSYYYPEYAKGSSSSSSSSESSESAAGLAYIFSFVAMALALL